MEYQIQRGDQKFGPYSLAELQQYVQEGRVLLTDLAQSDGMTDWVPVSQILGNIPIPAPAQVLAPPPQDIIPLPPNIHWVVILIGLALARLSALIALPLGILGLLFIVVWAIILANWARRLVNKNTALVLVAMFPTVIFAAILAATAGGAEGNEGLIAVAGFLQLAGWISYLVGIFKIRAAMEEYYNSKENIALTLSGAMTFFFSIVYLQYHINRIAQWKKTGILT